MLNPDTGDVLVYNGEIYNFKKLRQKLEQQGLKFRTGGDTEVLMRALEKWGTECLDMLDGMYSFALWRKLDGSLLLARDAMGIKPLYYSTAPNHGFAFASETKALVASGAVSSTIDPVGLSGFLAYGSVPEPSTIYEAVTPLAPGAWLEVASGGSISETGLVLGFSCP